MALAAKRWELLGLVALGAALGVGCAERQPLTPKPRAPSSGPSAGATTAAPSAATSASSSASPPSSGPVRVTVRASSGELGRSFTEALAALPDVVATAGAAASGVAVERLFDDPSLLEAFGARAPGVEVVVEPMPGAPDGSVNLLILVRLAARVQGGELGKTPPLTALRLVTLGPLGEPQAKALTRLVVATARSVDQPLADAGRDLGPYLTEARGLLDDPRLTGDASGAEPWTWQGRWSVLTAFGRAEWQQAELTADRATAHRSVEHLQAALATLRGQPVPLTTATGERLLGAALATTSDLAGEYDALDASVAAFSAAAKGFDRATHPDDWAFNAYDLASQSLTLCSREEEPARCRRALELLDDVTAVQTQRRAPIPWAAARLAAAAAHATLHQLGEKDHLEAARLATQEAQSTLTAATAPLAWALTQIRACAVELERGRLSDDEGKTIQAAAEPCHRALAVVNERIDPSLGLLVRAFASLADAYAGAARRDEAAYVAARGEYESALVRASESDDHATFATVLTNYFRLLKLSYEGEEETAKRITDAFERARTTTKDWPRWARIQRGKGELLFSLAQRLRVRFQIAPARALWEDALRAFEFSASVLLREKDPIAFTDLQQRMGDTLVWLGEGPRREYLSRAVLAYHRAMGVKELERRPRVVAAAQAGIGRAYLWWQDVNRGVTLPQAVAALRASLAARDAYGAIPAWSAVHDDLAEALSLLASRQRRPLCASAALREHAFRTLPPDAKGRDRLLAGLTREKRYARENHVTRQTCPDIDATFWSEP